MWAGAALVVAGSLLLIVGGMRIDVHAHVIVPEVLRDAAPDEAWRPRVWCEDGAQVVELGGRQIRSAVREFVDADAILAAQDEAGIDHVVLCPWVNAARLRRAGRARRSSAVASRTPGSPRCGPRTRSA